jgi:hypothetical protein
MPSPGFASAPEKKDASLSHERNTQVGTLLPRFAWQQ